MDFVKSISDHKKYDISIKFHVLRYSFIKKRLRNSKMPFIPNENTRKLEKLMLLKKNTYTKKHLNIFSRWFLQLKCFEVKIM